MVRMRISRGLLRFTGAGRPRLISYVFGQWFALRRLGVGEPWRDTIHFASAGAVCFSRGLNDTPKMAGLLMGIPWLIGAFAESGILAAMAIGGMLGARPIAETLGHGTTGMDAGEGLSANAETSAQTLTGRFHGLPVSTTHVSVGALLGIGIVGAKHGDGRHCRCSELGYLPCRSPRLHPPRSWPCFSGGFAEAVAL